MAKKKVVRDHRCPGTDRTAGMKLERMDIRKGSARESFFKMSAKNCSDLSDSWVLGPEQDMYTTPSKAQELR